jgi:Dyp-type peroxidase family
MLELSDIQGLVFSGYAQKEFAEYLLLRVADAGLARHWLFDISRQVTTGKDRPTDLCLNVALSARGLTALGLDEDSLGSFALEFREDMAGTDTRSRALGDVADSEPERWHWGSKPQPVDVLLMIFASSQQRLDAAIAQQLRAADGALHVVYRRSTCTLPERREHFGFADGIAQPGIAGVGDGDVAAGEFILGYKNAYGKLPFVPNVSAQLDSSQHLLAGSAPDAHGRAQLGRNGSYLVVRQLDQDVAGFWQYMRQAALEAGGPGVTAGDGAVYLAAKCVGRWPSGAPLVKAPDQDDARYVDDDDFGYFWRDRAGTRCPVGSHIRRTNPRDSLEPDPFSSHKVVQRHRILRRGRSYGEHIAKPWLGAQRDDSERGLFFMCVNANIRRQFELIQQTWVNNPKFDGLYDERDPLIGNTFGEAGSFTIPGKPVRKRLQGLPGFVQVRGGGYFFLPGIRALRFLADLKPSS